MDKDFISEVKGGVKHWYIPLIWGVVFLVAGFYTFSQSAEAYEALALLFGITFLVSGISEVIMSFSVKLVARYWGLTLILGIIDFVIGIILVSNLLLSMELLPLYVGMIIIFRSFSAISYYSELKAKKIKGIGSLLFLGILGVIIGMFMLISPNFGAFSIIIWTAMGFILCGIYGILLGFKLKGLKK